MFEQGYVFKRKKIKRVLINEMAAFTGILRNVKFVGSLIFEEHEF